MKTPKFSTATLSVLWLFSSVIYMSWLGPLLISAEYTPFVLLGFALALLLLWALTKLVHRAFAPTLKETK